MASSQPAIAELFEMSISLERQTQRATPALIFGENYKTIEAVN